MEADAGSIRPATSWGLTIVVAFSALAGCLAAPDGDVRQIDAGPTETLLAGEIQREFHASASGPTGSETFYEDTGDLSFDVPSTAQELVFVLMWTPSTPASRSLYAFLGSADGGFMGEASGESPLWIDVNESRIEPGETFIHIRSPPPGGASAAQTFQWEATITLAQP